MKRILIYDTTVKGHHLEYLHHIYMAAEDVDAEFIFVVPEEFIFQKKNLLWPTRHNVSFDFISNEEITKIGSCFLKKRWNLAKLAAKFIKRNKADEVFFVELIVQFPFLPLLIPKETKVLGILYRLFPYEWKRLSCFVRFKDVLETLSMARCKNVRNIFVLNDASVAAFFNRKIKTNKFIPLPDPIFETDYQPQNIRDEYHILYSETMFLHFHPERRKGTSLILDAINTLSAEEISDKVFVFIGRVRPDIRDEFYGKIKLLKDKAHIVCIDNYCSYQMIEDFFFSTDFVLLPYSNYSYSSGVLGYAAKYRKPVIGPAEGVLGKLIRREHLGMSIRELDERKIAKAIMSFKRCIRDTSYLGKNNPQTFSDCIITRL